MRLAAFVLMTALAGVAAAEVPFTLGVGAGAIAGVGPFRAAPSLTANAGVELPGGHFAITGRVDGWTLNAAGTVPANSEVTGSLGGEYSHELVPEIRWLMGAAASVTFLSRAGASLESRPGVLMTPGFEFATRRRTLALRVMADALLSTTGVRVGATAGVVYTFR